MPDIKPLKNTFPLAVRLVENHCKSTVFLQNLSIKGKKDIISEVFSAV